MTTNFSQTAAYIWSLADLLRGDFKQSQYGRVILPCRFALNFDPNSTLIYIDD